MTAADYWKNRAERNLLAEERKGAELIAALLGFYSDTANRLREDTEAFYRRYAGEKQITLEAARQMLTPKESASFERALARYLSESKRLGMGKEHERYLRLLSGQAQVTRQQALLAQARQQVETLFREGEDAFHRTLGSVYTGSYGRTMSDLRQGLRLSGQFAEMDTKTVERLLSEQWLGENYSSRLWKHKGQLVNQLEELIPRAFATGENSRMLGQQLAERLAVSRSAGERLARTEVARAANESVRRAYLDAGVTEYEYLATLDARTSEICAALDGRVFSVAKASAGVNYPPMHPNCRSTTIPHFPEDEFDGDYVRAARDYDGQYYTVPASTTYEGWKNTPESGMLKQISLDPITITREAIDALSTPPIPGWSDAKNTKLNRRHQELLQKAKELPVGTEVAAYMDEQLNGVVTTTGTIGSVSIPLDAGAVYMHNHPSGHLFTLDDVERLLFNENMRVLTAVGNNGHVYLLVKTEAYDFAGVHSVYRDKANNFSGYGKSPEAYVRFMDEFLRALWPHGLIYLEG